MSDEKERAERAKRPYFIWDYTSSPLKSASTGRNFIVGSAKKCGIHGLLQWKYGMVSEHSILASDAIFSLNHDPTQAA